MALWTPTQKVTAKKLKEEGCQRTYQVEVPAPRVQEAVHNVFLRMQLQARVSGFRQGKAPLDLIKQQYSDQARAQAADDLIKSAVTEIIQENKLHPVAVPSVGAVKMDPDKPLSFELHLELAPDFEPKGYKGLSVTRKTYKVADADVEGRLVQLQEGNARLEKSAAEAVGKDHYVIIDYELSRDGKPLPKASGKEELVDMSSDQTVKGLQEGLLGAKRQESREFAVELEGKSASCKATVVEIKEKILPKIDDEFAKDLGFDTLAALKAKLREIAEAEAAEKSEHELRQQIEESLLSSNNISIPPTLADHQLEHTMERLQRRFAGNKSLPESELQKLREKLRPEAENQVRLQFILSGIAKKENIAASDEDFKAELKKSLEKAESEEQKKDLQRFFEESKDDIRAAIRERKVLEFVRQASKLKEEAA